MQKFKILICDDEPDILQGLFLMLSKPDVEVVLAASGNEAIGHLKRSSFDVVVCDYMMSEGSGEDVLNHIEQTPSSRPRKFIFFSAHINLLDNANTQIEVVPKPNIVVLKNTVEAHLEERRRKEIDV